MIIFFLILTTLIDQLCDKSIYRPYLRLMTGFMLISLMMQPISYYLSNEDIVTQAISTAVKGENNPAFLDGAKEEKQNQIKEQITNIFCENKERYGYRRITMELHNRGYRINHKAVLRLMNEEKIKCQVRIKKYHSYKGEVGKVAPNLLERDFSTTAPNEKWATDVTEFSIFGQKLYLSPILDLHSSDIVSYTISDRPVLSMVMDMARQALAVLPRGAAPILHSDQGWQYQHKNYQKLLKDNGIIQSMSRKGNCLDNAVMENFFGILKSELLYLKEFDSIEQFKQELIEYLDYYNNRRIKAKLKGLPPAVHRKQALDAA